jgi:DNA topoisomerase-1
MPPKFYKKKFIKTGGEKKEKEINELATYLIIVESPSKCEKIESYLGSQYCCIASKGHIRTIDGLKSIDTKKTFEPTFTLINEKKDHVMWMQSVIEKFSKNNIILASDDDREGEAIAWHICKVFNLPIETTPRIIFHEVTKPALIEAINTPIRINMNLVHAQQARQVLDIIVGYKISPYLWKYIFNSKSNSLSAGRCQTPALRLVYDNEKSVKELETKYKTTGIFFSQNIQYELNKEFDEKGEVLEFLEKSIDFNYKLTNHTPRESIKSPPKPFHTSRLLQVANNVLHISPKETMGLCQKLYQSGFITYMRTESSQYSSVFLEKAKEYIISQYGEKYVGLVNNIANKETGTPHEAIRVTNIELTQIDSTESRLISMYRLIWKNTVESCMAEATYNNIKTIIDAPMGLEYKYTIEIPIFLGWKKISEKNLEDEQNKSSSIHMFLKNITGKFSYQWLNSEVIVRNKHQHYTEASLISKLEDLGIGRPSTFASIVDTIIERGYVKKIDIEGSLFNCDDFKLIDKNIEKTTKEKMFGNEKNKLVIQPTGILAVEFLLKTFEQMFSYEYTKTMELDLDLISSGKQSDWSKICANCHKDIKVLSNEIRDISKQVYPIDIAHDLIFAPFGPIIKHKYIDNNEEKVDFLQVKRDINIDLEKAKKGIYNLDDLLEIKNNCLGEYEDNKIYIKTGRFGPYVEWGEKRESIKSIEKPLCEITLDDIKHFLSNTQEKTENNLLRRLNDDMSVRKGKFGPYIFYQRSNMKKPLFLNIKKFNKGFFNCDAEDLVNWCKETYNL